MTHYLPSPMLPAGTPVRLAVMDWFDGSVWNLSDSSKASDCANYQRVGTTISTDERGMAFTATFTVHRGLADVWLPLSWRRHRRAIPRQR